MKTEKNTETEENEICEATESKEKQLTVMKRIFGIMLAVSAAVFGGVLERLPSVVAFAVVFLYISIEVFMWIAPNKNKNEKNKFF